MAGRSIYARIHGRGDEDAQTEVFVGTLERTPQLATRVVGDLVGLDGLEIQRIVTQAVHDDDRPDIQFECDDRRGLRHVIFVESKVASVEGHRQLERYAARLQTLIRSGAAAHGHLVYLTARHESPRQPVTGEPSVSFRQLRWHDIHRSVRRAIGAPSADETERVWAEELLAYLEDRGMTDATTFGPDDLIALQKMPKVVRMMENCLDGPVWSQFQVLAGKHAGKPNWATQLRDRSRYIYYSQQTSAWFVGIGFVLGERASEPDYSDLIVMLETVTTDPSSVKLLAAFDTLTRVEGSAWVRRQWTTKWPGVAAVLPLRSILGEADHVASSRAWFLKRLDELISFRESNQDLGWSRSV